MGSAVMKMVRKVAGREEPAEIVERVEAELEGLCFEGSTLCTKADDCEDALDLETDPDKILRHMAEIRAAKNRVKQIDNELAELKERLELARSAVRAELLAKLKVELAAASADFITKGRAAVDAADRARWARAAIEDAGFGHAAAQFERVPGMHEAITISGDILDRFEANVERALYPQPFAAQLTRLPAKATSTRMWRDGIGMIDASQAATAKPLPPVPLPSLGGVHVKVDRPLFDEPAQAGQRRIVILRAGAADDQHGQLVLGDVIALPASEAEAFVRSGSADFAAELETVE